MSLHRSTVFLLPSGQATSPRMISDVLPTGIPNETVQQSGASITAGEIAAVAIGVGLFGVLAYYLTRTAPVVMSEPAVARRTRRRRARR